MSISILAIGDTHLGRQPALPERLRARLSAAELAPSVAWRLSVEAAFDLDVDAVVLAGDVVEQEDDFYEAYGELHEGVERLIEAGIPVLAVAGNHDVKVLPRLADVLPKFQLLGRGGIWEEVFVESRSGAGDERLAVVGWSFPERRVTRSPLDTFAQASYPHADCPSLGLLHCDLDRLGSAYAPVAKAKLVASPLDGWLLGHIHRPDRLDRRRPIGYLGSLVGLDPTETGLHGPWLLEVAGGGVADLHQLPLAPLRWERVTCDVSDLDEPAAVRERIPQAVRETLETVLGEQRETSVGEHLRALGCRVRLTGRTALGPALEAEIRDVDPTDLVFEQEGVQCFVDRVDLTTEPALDLSMLASGHDPIALLARKVLTVRASGGPDAARDDLLGELRDHLDKTLSAERGAQQLRRVQRASGEHDRPGDLDDAALGALLDRAICRLLDVVEVDDERTDAAPLDSH